jgi:hypothetical protein
MRCHGNTLSIFFYELQSGEACLIQMATGFVANDNDRLNLNVQVGL